MYKILITFFAAVLMLPAFSADLDLSRITIAGPTPAKPIEQKAMVELKHHLGLIAKSNGGGQTIRLITDSTLPPDGYRIGFEGNDLEVRGGTNFGLLYGVYALLEEDFGCRWYEPQITVIPAPENPVFQVKERSSQPAFTAIRDPFSYLEYNVDWSLRNRCVKTMGRNIPAEFGECISYPTHPEFWMAHTVQYFCPDELFKTNPEYFMVNVNGKRTLDQICPSNPEVKQRAIEKILSVLRKYPQHNIINLSLKDNMEYCHCADCEVIVKAENSDGAAFFRLVNQVAEAVAAEFPGVKVSFLAYYSTTRPPAKMKMAPNTVCFLAFLGGRNMSVPAEEQPPFPEVVAGWQKTVPEIHIWDYQVYFPNFMQYELSLHSVMENLRYYRKFDRITGVMLQGAYCGPGGERQGLRAWVESKLLWDPDRDVWELSQDYIRGVYGVAAPEVEKFYRVLHELEKQHQSYQPHQEKIMAAGMDSFAKAKELAKDDQVLLNRLELAELPVVVWQIDKALGDRYGSSGVDNQKVSALLDQLEKVVAREKISNLGEGTGKTIKDYIANCRKSLSNPVLTYPDRLSPQSRIVPATDGNLFGSKAEPDTNSKAPKIVHQFPDSNWSWQMRMDKLGISPGKYQMRLRCRAVKTGATQKVLHYGVHNVGGAATGSRTLPAADLLHADYRWHDLGVFQVNSSSYLFTMLQAKDNHMELYIEALEITPVGD